METLSRLQTDMFSVRLETLKIPRYLGDAMTAASNGTTIESNLVACLALGSRGDTEPLLAVLSHVVMAAAGSMKANFACRKDVWAELANAHTGAPAGVVHVPIRDCSVAMSIALAARRKDKDPRFVYGTGGISAREADEFVEKEREDMIQCALGARLVICNLFCLEGVHIAEAIGVPCVILSPCLSPNSMPLSFQQQFSDAMPTLYKRLVEEQHRQSQQQPVNPWHDPLALVSADARCSWDDVQCWMWRLFLDDHGEWREKALGLSATPLEAWDTSSYTAPLPPRPILLVGVSPTLAALALRGTCPHGSQSALIETPFSLSSHAHVGVCCGPWRPAARTHASLPHHVLAFLAAAQRSSRRVACVSFGSMAKLGFIDFGERDDVDIEKDEGGAAEGAVAVGAEAAVVGEGGELLLALLDCLHSEGLRAVWLLEHCPPRVAAALRRRAHELGREEEDDLMSMCAVSHALLLPSCALVVHHGGAGVVAESVLASTPQVMCPVTMDQPLWAAALSSMPPSSPPQSSCQSMHCRPLAVLLPFFRRKAGETDRMQLVGEAIHRIMLLAKECGSEMMRPASSSSTSTSHNNQAADRKEESETERERQEGHRDGGKVMCGGKEEKGNRGRTRKRACLVGQGGKGAGSDCEELHSFNCVLPVSDKSCVWQRALEREINQGVPFAGAVVAAVMAREGLRAKEGPLARERAQMAESGDGQARRARERES